MTDNKEWLDDVRREFRIAWFKGSEFHHDSQTALSVERHSEPYNLEFRGYFARAEKDKKEIERLNNAVIARAGDAKFWQDQAEYFDGCSREKDQTIFNIEEEITALKEELKRERECVDFYANKKSWKDTTGYQSPPESMEIDWSDMENMPDRYYGGKFARLAQSQRKIKLEEE